MYIFLGVSIMIHLKNDYKFWFILETQTEFNYGNRPYIESISKDHMKIMLDSQNDFIKQYYIEVVDKNIEKKFQRALNRNELI